VNCEELRQLRDPYIDGELAASIVAMAETHLRCCTDCRDLVEGGRTLKSAIRSTASRYDAPPLLAARLRRETKAPPATRFGSLRYLRTGWNPVAIAAALLLTMATSIGVTRSYVVPGHEDQVVGAVVASHVRSLMADHLTDVAFSPQSGSRPSGARSFFAGKVEVVPPAIDMAAAGYALVGARLDYVADHRCAALVYRHDTHVINLEVWTRAGAERGDTDTYTRDGYNIVHSTEGNLDFWAVSDLSRSELADFMRKYMAGAETRDERI
jgi:anti-sigma factor RsiW